MNPSNLLHGSLENLKLISDDVWNVFDYDTEFKDVFANITRRESLLSHRFNSISPAEILSDLQYTVTPENQPLRHQAEPIDTIFDGEIFKGKDGLINEQDNFSYSDIDKVENAYWTDVRTVGCGRQSGEANVTYNNSFDPRLTFNGLLETPRGSFVDDLEREILNQHNFCYDVEDVTELADEYYNKYREYLNHFIGSKKTQKKYKEKILAGQPPNPSDPPPKSFSLKTCWENEDERRLAQKLSSQTIKNIWKNSANILHTDDQKITFGHKTTNESFTQMQMTPSPLSNVSEIRRTPGPQGNRMDDDQAMSVPRLNSIDDLLSTPLRHMWKEAWSNDRNRETTTDKLSNQQEKNDPLLRTPEMDIKFDLEIINGNVKILPRNSMPNLSFSETKSNNIQYFDPSESMCSYTENQPRERNTSKASSDTRVFLDEGRFIPVITSARPNKDRAKSMRSESSLTKIETTSNQYRKNTRSPQSSPRIESKPNYAEGNQLPTSAVQSSKAQYEILPQTHCSYSRMGLDAKSNKIKEETIEEIQHGDCNVIKDQQSLSTGPSTHQQSIEVPKEITFFDKLKLLGWFEGNATSTNNQDQNRTQQPDITNGSSLPYSTSEQNQSSKRQLFKSPKTNKLEILDFLSKDLSQFGENRSRSVSPMKRKAIQNSSFDSQLSSPMTDSQNTSLVMNSPEPRRTLSQLNAACEPFVPAHLQNRDLSRQTSPTKPIICQNQMVSKQMSPTKSAYQQFVSSPTKSAVKDENLMWQPSTMKPTCASTSNNQSQVLGRRTSTKTDSDSSANDQTQNSTKQIILTKRAGQPIGGSNPTTPTKLIWHPAVQTSNQVHDLILHTTPPKPNVESIVSASRKNQDISPGISPGKMSYIENLKMKQTNAQSPTKEGVKKLLQSPEVLVPFIANSDSKQAFLLQQKMNQIQRQAAEQPSSPESYRVPQQLNQFNLHPHQQQYREQIPRSPQTSRGGVRESVISPQHNVKNMQPLSSYPPRNFHFPPPTPMVRTNPIVPPWPCPPPPVSRNMNFTFHEPRPRPMMPQGYGPPYIAWQTFPGFQPHHRIIHPVFNMNNNSSTNAGVEEYPGIYRSASNDSLNSFRDQSEDIVTKPSQPARSARPIRANPANLIHISTK